MASKASGTDRGAVQLIVRKTFLELCKSSHDPSRPHEVELKQCRELTLSPVVSSEENSRIRFGFPDPILALDASPCSSSFLHTAAAACRLALANFRPQSAVLYT